MLCLSPDEYHYMLYTDLTMSTIYGIIEDKEWEFVCVLGIPPILGLRACKQRADTP